MKHSRKNLTNSPQALEEKFDPILRKQTAEDRTPDFSKKSIGA
jgi:hypothetical protein